jgi:hypothetical protein
LRATETEVSVLDAAKRSPMNGPEFHPCQICSAFVQHQLRYPDAVCRDCYGKACDSQGRKLNFFNLSMNGGFETVLADTALKVAKLQRSATQLPFAQTRKISSTFTEANSCFQQSML